jgi:hypothetical protein
MSMSFTLKELSKVSSTKFLPGAYSFLIGLKVISIFIDYNDTEYSFNVSIYRNNYTKGRCLRRVYTKLSHTNSN